MRPVYTQAVNGRRTRLVKGGHMTVSQAATPEEVLARIERLPLSAWQIRTRLIVGTATFFDAFDALAITYVLPAVAPAWKLTPAGISSLISAGFLGQLLGALVGGALAERIGRRPVIVAAVLWFGLFSFACGLAWNYESLVAMRLLQGFGLGAEVPVAATYISELARAEGRGRFVLLFELVFPIGLVAVALMGRSIVPVGWQYLFFVGGLPALLALVMMRDLPESPRWLAARGRLVDAAAAIALIEQKVQAATGKPLPEVKAAPRTVIAKRGAWTELFSDTCRRRTLVIWAAWFATYFVNYGLTTWLPTIYRTLFKLSLEDALNYALISQAIGLFTSFSCAMLIDRVGRRVWFALAFAGAAAALLTLWWIGPSSAERILVFAILTNLCVSTLSLALYLYTAELYPTRIRALGTATGTAWLRIASILGPQVFGNTVGSGSIGAAFLVFGLVALGACVVVALFATETKGRVLEEISP
jgi:MFS transporter, putative metabolite:H+ symporter